MNDSVAALDDTIEMVQIILHQVQQNLINVSDDVAMFARTAGESEVMHGYTGTVASLVVSSGIGDALVFERAMDEIVMVTGDFGIQNSVVRNMSGLNLLTRVDGYLSIRDNGA